MSDLRPLGRLVEHDERSRAYAFTAPRKVTLQSVQHASHIGILDQGSLGSCTGNATVGALGCDPFYGTLSGVTLDEQEAIQIYSEATKLDSFPGTYPPDDNGSSGLAAAKAAKNAGLISGYQHAFSVDDALAALQQGPVITGVSWYEGFDKPDQTGLVKISGSVRGGHEFVVTGYDDANQIVWAHNSWGEDYGVHGLFCFTVDTWATLLKADGDATIFVPLTLPAPTPGAASFPVSQAVADRIHTVAGHRSMSTDAWVEQHFRRYFGLP